jgi:hypothetical protein
VVATAFDARFWPLTVMNEPGVMLPLPSLAFTMPPGAGLVTGVADAPEGASEVTLRPESVMA